MSKQRTSVSLDENVAEYLQRPGVNASGLVNKLVKEHMAGGVTDEYLRKLREEQVQSEIKSLESQAEKKREELERIRERESRTVKKRNDAIDGRLEQLADVRMEIDTDHPTVNALAQEYFGGDRDAALEAMRDRNDELEHVPEDYL